MHVKLGYPQQVNISLENLNLLPMNTILTQWV